MMWNKIITDDGSSVKVCVKPLTADNYYARSNDMGVILHGKRILKLCFKKKENLEKEKELEGSTMNEPKA